MADNLDVLIIGAGPVGLALACELARYGVRLRIVDSDDARTTQSRALVMWPRTLEHLSRMGLDQRFLDVGEKVTEAHFYEGPREFTSVRLDEVDTPYRYALMIPQSRTEQLLEERLQELGVRVQRGVTCTSVRQEEDGSLKVGLALPDDSNEEVEPKWLVGCDGTHSVVRHSAELSFEEHTKPSHWVLADVHLEGAVDRDRLELHMHADGVLGIFPLPPGRFRVVAAHGHGTGEPTLEEIQTLLDKRVGRDLEASDPLWLTSFHISERMVKHFRKGHLLLAGDAAHTHSPSGGQGMNTGMQDAFNLAWKLALILQGHVSKTGAEILLNSYSVERAPVAHSVIAGAGLLTRLASLDNLLLNKMRNYAMRTVFGFGTTKAAFAEAASELAVSYDRSPLNGRDDHIGGGPRVGERAPLVDTDKPRSAGTKPQFVLYAHRDENAEELLACYPEWIEPEIRAPFAEGGIWLVRPDGYVAHAGDSDSWAAADMYLARLMYEQE
ncbi:MAG: FAD-dependent monooxygenase [Acidobacteriaceae bacterium]|nr:FAD-dependent monooxygenase [Acidobacteriaceae bacterium]